MASSSSAVIGSTGLVGSHILSTLLAGDAQHAVSTITRRAPKATAANLNAVVNTDTTQWASLLSALAPAPVAVFSALGTTRAAAGGLANPVSYTH